MPRLISFKGQSVAWRGKSSLNVSDRGERRMLRLENGYVSADGSEIRTFPGFFTLWDNSEANNPNNYAGAYTTDVIRPIYNTSPNAPYQYGYYPASPLDPRLQTLIARAKPTHYHGFEQIGETVIVWGESRLREAPILDSSRNLLNPVDVRTVAGAWVITLNAAPGAYSASDATGAGLNSVVAGNIVLLEGLRVASPSVQALLDAELNGRQHFVGSIAGADITLGSLSSGTVGTTALTDGEIHVIRANRADYYPATAGAAPPIYDPNPLRRPDDPDCLTAWRLSGLRRGQPIVPCITSWAVTRRRDCGDLVRSGFAEGILFNAVRGVSRREQRELPYRTNGIDAADRVILAAPQYGVMWHIPVKVPIDPDAWRVPITAQGLGIPLPGNSIYDMPRALGIPKARMVEAMSTLAAPSSPTAPLPYNFAAKAFVGAPALGVTSGVWKMAIAFEDEATGEEGLASETVTVDIPSNAFAYTLRVVYIHPGYVMPETAAFRLNVYLAPPGTEALAYYASFPLSSNPRVGTTLTVNNTNYNTSGFYGFEPTSPVGPDAIYRSIDLPLLGDATAIEAQLDPERLAPQSASMPRGADACRMIRGVLFAGGNVGNIGGNRELWQSKASARYDPTNSYESESGLIIRVHGSSYSVPGASQDGDIGTSSFGVAGRCFPDAFQGVEVVSNEVFPAGVFFQRIDRVVNRKTNDLTSGLATQHLQYERLELTKPIYNRTRTGGSAATTVITSQYGADVYYVMPKGQLQIGDPGAPARSSKAAIQFVDANRGDDITAIGGLAGTAVICTRRETYTFSWHRNAGGEIPNFLSGEHGCVAANSMVEFDGGVAWLGERGPVALGNGLQFVGIDVQEDFYGQNRRYASDSKGMMRHAWGCHDAARGIVMWGLVTRSATHTLAYRGTAFTFDTASDEARSRFPCDEVLIWSYRSGSFSTWRPPSGLEVYWMRPVRLPSGEMVIAFLAADGRIYGFDDVFSDCNLAPNDFTPTAATTGTAASVTSAAVLGTDGLLVSGRDGNAFHLRAGMRVEVLRDDRIVDTATIAEIVSVTSPTASLTWSKALDIRKTDIVRIGTRPPLTLVTSYLGAETMDNLNVKSMQMRFSMLGPAGGQARVSMLRSDFTTAREVSMGPWESVGVSNAIAANAGETYQRVGQRVEFLRGGFDAPEGAIKVEYSGPAQLRVADLSLEVD